MLLYQISVVFDAANKFSMNVVNSLFAAFIFWSAVSIKAPTLVHSAVLFIQIYFQSVCF